MLLSDLKIRKAKQRDKLYLLSDGMGLILAVKPTGCEHSTGFGRWSVHGHIVKVNYRRDRDAIYSLHSVSPPFSCPPNNSLPGV